MTTIATTTPATARPRAQVVAPAAAARAKALAPDTLAVSRAVVAREPAPKKERWITVDIAVPLAMGMCAVGGFGFLFATAPGAAGLFSATALGCVGLLAAGVLMGMSSLPTKLPKLVDPTPGQRSTALQILGGAAPGLGLVLGGLAAKALGFAGGGAAVLCSLGCIAGIGIFKDLNR